MTAEYKITSAPPLSLVNQLLPQMATMVVAEREWCPRAGIVGYLFGYGCHRVHGFFQPENLPVSSTRLASSSLQRRTGTYR